MKPQFNTEGVILKRISLNETDQIITLFSPERGKMSVLAKGSKRLKSKFCGQLELLSQVTVSGFQGKELAYLDEVTAVKIRPLTDTDLKTKSVLFFIAEITQKVVHEGQENHEVYNLLVETLDQVTGMALFGEESGNKREVLLYGYLIKLITLLGVMAPWEKCSRSGEPLNLREPLFLSSGDMSVIKNGYQESNDPRLPVPLIKWINFMQKSPMEELLCVSPSPGERMQVWQIIQSVFRNLLSHPLRSEAFLMKVS